MAHGLHGTLSHRKGIAGLPFVLSTPSTCTTTTLMAAIADRREEIDALVSDAAIGWDLHRMAVVDRNVLRLATAELLASDDVPTAVILNEAVELARDYSTDSSCSFVNGILATAIPES